MIWWTGHAPWEFEFSFLGSLTYAFLESEPSAISSPRLRLGFPSHTVEYELKESTLVVWGFQVKMEETVRARDAAERTVEALKDELAEMLDLQRLLTSATQR